jgi:hypothetical protein
MNPPLLQFSTPQLVPGAELLRNPCVKPRDLPLDLCAWSLEVL